MSTTEQDPFDSQLQAMFAEAALPEQSDDSERFTQRVLEGLNKPQKARFLAIGGAGATGSAVAGTQLEGLINSTSAEFGGYLGQAMGFIGPESIATLLMAVVVGAVGYFVPRQLQVA